MVIRTPIATGFAIVQTEAGLADNEGFALIHPVGNACFSMPSRSLRVSYDTPETRRCDLFFKEFFWLSMKETFLTWTVLSTLVSVVDLAVILLISMSIA